MLDGSLEDSNQKVAMRMLSPPHPGQFIGTGIIAPLGLSVTAAADVLGVSRPALSSLLNAKAGLSGDMALRIEKAFGVKVRHKDGHAHAVFFRHRACPARPAGNSSPKLLRSEFPLNPSRYRK